MIYIGKLVFLSAEPPPAEEERTAFLFRVYSKEKVVSSSHLPSDFHMMQWSLMVLLSPC